MTVIVVQKKKEKKERKKKKKKTQASPEVRIEKLEQDLVVSFLQPGIRISNNHQTLQK